ncbi:anthranilate phosphoribosyltransferase [Candidatus Thiothrix sp. Deng01]|uniref:Anthranilate phosphoribosyltransferase n=1 Tax=Candidatus Thiothrix phosphatis TaxID=3112415 RepID=A0ABU6CRL2_9GAMM|nr:anthranilate phosphoribosyltransferase [Candidatus Thiothrix sp. Deng01]MEB4589482.1 anthranilate phosphoribosyltransferase [Candidatus Thiothrix sp. Deng01]
MTDINTDLNLKLHMRQCIQKVATGPEYSKDLSYEDAYNAMRHILSGEADPVQVAVYFIALRMKRETDEENRGTLQALIDVSVINTANVDEVLDISDPYDGYTRGVPASTFVPAVLATMGVHSVLHGLEQVGPKFGATHHKILKAVGLNVNLTPAEAVAQLERIGWAYLDQRQFAPRLHDLIPIRQRMIKRQVLTTVETLLGPIRGQRKTHCMGGYVHKGYPAIYASLARQAGFDSAMFVRGVEGGIIPSLQQAGKLFYYYEKVEEQQRDLMPADIGIQAEVRAVPLPGDLPAAPVIGDEIATAVDSDALAVKAAELGMAALGGEKGLMYDSLVYSTSICLAHLGRYGSMQEAADAVRTVLDGGKALETLRAAA